MPKANGLHLFFFLNRFIRPAVLLSLVQLHLYLFDYLSQLPPSRPIDFADCPFVARQFSTRNRRYLAVGLNDHSGSEIEKRNKEL